MGWVGLGFIGLICGTVGCIGLLGGPGRRWSCRVSTCRGHASCVRRGDERGRFGWARWAGLGGVGLGWGVGRGGEITCIAEWLLVDVRPSLP